MLIIVILTILALSVLSSSFIGILLNIDFLPAYILTVLLHTPIILKIYKNEKEDKEKKTIQINNSPVKTDTLEPKLKPIDENTPIDEEIYDMNIIKLKNENKALSETETIDNLVTKSKTLSIDNNYSNKYSFRVVGVTKQNDKDLSIPKILENYLEEHMLRTAGERYDSMTNKEIEEWDIEIFEYQPAVTYFKLIPEPENPYDKNAIKVVHEEIDHVGYVPKNKTEEVKELLVNDPLVKGVIRGGNFKYLDYETGKVEKNFINYNIVIKVLY